MSQARVCLALAGAILLSASCRSAPPPPPPPRVAPEPVAPTPPPEPPPPPTLEEDATPSGAACESSAECASGEQCRGPAGCTAAWACGAARECGNDTVSYCGCDGLTFYAPSNCPGRPYTAVGPCEALGETVSAAEQESVEGNSICQSSGECRSGLICTGVEGCGTFWTCARRRGRRCTRDRATFCGCDGTSFEASSTCPGRPYLHRGACGDGGAIATSPSGSSSAGSTAGSAQSSATVAHAAAGARATADASRGAPDTAAVGGSASANGCQRNADCPRGQVCQGIEGCGGPWTCGRPANACSADTQYFCGCDGVTFRASMTCPGRPHRRRGSC